MWAIFPTILLATNDVRLRDPGIERILLNAEAIAVNRAPAPPPPSRLSPCQARPIASFITVRKQRRKVCNVLHLAFL